MKTAGLTLEQAPPMSVPFRFFLSAPAFLLLAALILLWRGPEAFESPASPAALAVTHLLTLGFMSMVMMGAFMQMLPVLAGSPIPMARTTGAVTHLGLTLGALSFAAGFLFGQPWLLQGATVAFGVGLAVFLAAVTTSLARVRVQNSTVRGMWLAALSLLVTAVFGVALALSFGWGAALPNGSVRQLHPAWGLIGWTGLLVVGVAYQVVPMFQITPAYPRSMTRYLGAVVLALLGVWSVALWLGDGAWGALAIACALALCGAYVLFAVTTIVLQRRRKRRLPDVVLDFWRVGMGSLIGACVLWALRVAAPWDMPDGVDVLLGLLVLVGFAGSVINGMLYKIAPFLAWFHLQSLAGLGRLVPNMKKILGDADQRLQYRVHVTALALLMLAVAWPEVLVYPAAIALGAAAVMLEANLVKVLRVYRDNLVKR